MNINYLSVLPKVQQHQEKNYTLLEDKGDGFKSTISDTINFNNADRDGDKFLTYDELIDIKLALAFDAKKDKFELTKGINFISKDAVDEIFTNSGISLKSLQDELRNLDKNNDKEIKADEIASLDTSALVKKTKRNFRTYKLQEIKNTANEEIQTSSKNKRIASLDKQIKSLKKMLGNLTSQKSQEPIKVSTKEIENHTSATVENIVKVNELKSKYGDKEVSKLINVIKSTPKVENNIQSIISKTDTKVSKEEILDLSASMDMVVDTKIAVSEMSDMSAIEQLSPANTPLDLDSKNIDFSINQIKEKINDLEGMKSKIINEEMDKVSKKLDILA